MNLFGFSIGNYSTFLTDNSWNYAKKQMKEKYGTNIDDIFPSNQVNVSYKNIDHIRYAEEILNYTFLRFNLILNNAPKLNKEVFIYRGIRTQRETSEHLQRFSGIQSYSINPNSAFGFASRSGGVIRMKIQKNTPILYLGSISEFPYEEEVLIPSNGIFYKLKHCEKSTYISKFQVLYIKLQQEENCREKSVYGEKLKKKHVNLLPITYIWSKKSSAKNYKFVKNKVVNVRRNVVQ